MCDTFFVTKVARSVPNIINVIVFTNVLLNKRLISSTESETLIQPTSERSLKYKLFCMEIDKFVMKVPLFREKMR